jgi:hypothetical protein
MQPRMLRCWLSIAGIINPLTDCCRARRVTPAIQQPIRIPAKLLQAEGSCRVSCPSAYAFHPPSAVNFSPLMNFDFG